MVHLGVSVPTADGYNVWRTTEKQEIPNARSPGAPPLIVAVVGCEPTAVKSCVDVDGPLSPDTVFFYQVRAVCVGVEGP